MDENDLMTVGIKLEGEEAEMVFLTSPEGYEALLDAYATPDAPQTTVDIWFDDEPDLLPYELTIDMSRALYVLRTK